MSFSCRGLRAATALLCASAVALSGCATSSSSIAATYVSPLTYRHYDCDQISAELLRVQTRVQQMGGRLDQAASNDKALVGVGMLLFWPALFALGGTKEQEAEYARMKGEYEALQQAGIERKCSAAPAAPPAAPGAASAPAPAASAASAAS